MAFLDIRTALLMVGLLYLILPTITWVVLAGQRSRQVALWCGGGLLAGGGMVLSGLQGSTVGAFTRTHHIVGRLAGHGVVG